MDFNLDTDEDMNKQHPVVCAPRPSPMYKSSQQLMKEKLERIKAQMERASVDHLLGRPER